MPLISHECCPLSPFVFVLLGSAFGATPDPITVDLCVYGATPAGVNAAIAAKQEGLSVVLVEPSRWLGGILGAGLKPAQDCPVQSVVGGLTKKQGLRARPVWGGYLSCAPMRG